MNRRSFAVALKIEQVFLQQMKAQPFREAL